MALATVGLSWCSDSKESACTGGKVKQNVSPSCLTLCDPMDYSPWNFPGQNTGVGSLSLLPEIFPNPRIEGLLHCRQILYQLSYQGRGFNSWVTNIPWRRDWQPGPVFLPGEFLGQRSPVGYNPWGRKESDTTERLTL